MPCAVFYPRLLQNSVDFISMTHHRNSAILLFCHCIALCGLIKLPAYYHFVLFSGIIVFQACYCLPTECCCSRFHPSSFPACFSHFMVYYPASFPSPFPTTDQQLPIYYPGITQGIVYFLSRSLMKMSAETRTSTLVN